MVLETMRIAINSLPRRRPIVATEWRRLGGQVPRVSSGRPANICSHMKGVQHPDHVVQRALELVDAGVSDRDIGRRLEISRSTVQRWRRAGPPKGRPRVQIHLRPLDERAFAYLLGA